MLEVNIATGLPLQRSLIKMMGNAESDFVAQCVEDALIVPAADLISRPSKRFRAQLVNIGYELGLGSPGEASQRRLQICAQAVELLHAGSLIVDDIQDGSSVRRGGAAIHNVYGMPSALCTGNWLYFWPLRLLRELKLSSADEHQAFGLYHEALEQAHYGQALDLSLRISRISRLEVPELARALVELKTGSLTALALSLGALLAGSDGESLASIGRYGRRFGAYLQELDDLGNLLGDVDPEKRQEDMRRGKLSGVWAYVVKLFDEETYAQLLAAADALGLGNAQALEAWLSATDFAKNMRTSVAAELKASHDEFAEAMGLPLTHSALTKLAALGDVLLYAYG